MADAASCAGVDASLRADMGGAERGGSEATRAGGYISRTSEQSPLLVICIWPCLRSWRVAAGLAECRPPVIRLRLFPVAISASTMPSPQPPVPFADFECVFDPVLSTLFPPSSAPLPPSADLFSPSETTDLLGFLDNFNWDLESDPAFHDLSNPPIPIIPPHLPSASPPLPPNGFPPAPSPSSSTKPEASLVHDDDLLLPPTPPESTSRSRSARRKSISEPRQTARAKPLLSMPQKRLNHIMSEQKRRNAIRDGYAQLIALMAPAGTQTIDLPSRGRPKGSGTRSNGQTKGKSGVLFRAVEYCRWLEEGRDALREEVVRLEAAAIALNARSVQFHRSGHASEPFPSVRNKPYTLYCLQEALLYWRYVYLCRTKIMVAPRGVIRTMFARECSRSVFHGSISNPSFVAYTQLRPASRGSQPRRCHSLFEQLSP